MKTIVKKTVRTLLATGAAVLLTSCGTDHSAAKDAPVYKVAVGPAVAPATAQASLPPAAPDPVIATEEATGTNAPVEKVIVSEPTLPANMKVSPEVQEVIRLAEAGVEESVMLAFVENSPNRFEITSDQILYLNDIGVPSSVVTAMIQHSVAGKPRDTIAAATNTPPQVLQAPLAQEVAPNYPVVSSAASPADYTAPPVATVAVPDYVTAAPATQVTYNYFYSSLSPYGYWVDVPGYGLCWQPTVAVVNTGWQPYCDRGRWLDSDAGWYWHSDYSWGWAPFHYGRWSRPHGFGWVWVPDTTWGPSWVTWRTSGAYCGWAPLPPRAVYRSGVGFMFNDAHVSVSFGFGLSHDHYTFVPRNHFVDRNLRSHALRGGRETVNIYNNSTVINNYVSGRNNTVVNQGISRDKIASATRTEIPKVTIRDTPSNSGTRIRPDRIQQSGATPVVYRPPAPSVKTDTAQVIRTQEETRRTMPVTPRNNLSGSRPGDTPAQTMPGSTRPSSVTPATPGGFASRPQPNTTSPSVPSRQESTSSPLSAPSNLAGRPQAAPRNESVQQTPQSVLRGAPARNETPVTSRPQPAASQQPIATRQPEPVTSRPAAPPTVSSSPLRGSPVPNQSRPQSAPRNESLPATRQGIATRQPEPVMTRPAQNPIVPPLASRSEYSAPATPVPQISSRPAPSVNAPAPAYNPVNPRNVQSYDAPSRPVQNYQPRSFEPSRGQTIQPQRVEPAIRSAPPAVRNTPIPVPSYSQPQGRYASPAPSYSQPQSRPAPSYSPPPSRPAPSQPAVSAPAPQRSAPVQSSQPSNGRREERR